MRVSENVRQVEPSSTLAIAALCRELRAKGRDVLDLGVGEPDFRTPEYIAQAGIASIEQGLTQYPPVAGIPALREAIAHFYGNAAGKKMDAAGVVVTSGAKQALFNVCFVLFGPGDQVLIPAPYWTSYPALVKLARAGPVILNTTPESGFRVTVDDLKRAYNKNVRGLILNSPSNPTGAVYSAEELSALLEWARANDVWIVSDEIYGRIYFNGPRAPSMLDVTDSMDQLVVVDGASKAFAMTGWRLGFSYTTRELASKLSDLQSQITSGASAPAQYAAHAAFKDIEQANQAIRAMGSVFRMRRDKVLAHFAELAPEAYCFPPDGAFYVFVRLDQYYTAEAPDSASFCRWLLEQTDVALVPGAAFGDDRFARLSIAAPNATLAEAIRRIGAAVQPALKS